LWLNGLGRGLLLLITVDDLLSHNVLRAIERNRMSILGYYAGRLLLLWLGLVLDYGRVDLLLAVALNQVLGHND
jgi:hypothetical protein